MPNNQARQLGVARRCASTSVPAGLGLFARHVLAAVGRDDALAATLALDTRAVSIAGTLPVSLLSAAARW